MAYHLGKCLIAMLKGEWDKNIMTEVVKKQEREVQQLSIPGLNI